MFHVYFLFSMNHFSHSQLYDDLALIDVCFNKVNNAYHTETVNLIYLHLDPSLALAEPMRIQMPG